MEFDYYVNDGINRLFRHARATGQQDRWDDTPGTWANVAPSLVDKIYSGTIGLDEVTPEEAERGYPRAFAGNSFSATVNTMQAQSAGATPLEEGVPNNRARPDESREYAERVILTPELMNKIQVCISHKLSAENFIKEHQIAEADQATVQKFYADLEAEMAERVLRPGQFWDVSSEWS